LSLSFEVSLTGVEFGVSGMDRNHRMITRSSETGGAENEGVGVVNAAPNSWGWKTRE